MLASLLAAAFMLPVPSLQAPGAVAAAREHVAAAERDHGPDSLEAAEALVKLFGQLAAGDADEQLAVAQRVVAIREAKLPADHARLGIALCNLASAHMRKHRPEVALPLLERADRVLAKNPPSRARLGALTNLGGCKLLLGDYAAARVLLADAVAYGRRHASSHPLFAQTLQNHASVLLRFGEVEAARALVQETVAVLQRAEPDGARYAHAIHGLGHVLLEAQRFDDAEPLLQQALELRRRQLGERHGDVGAVEVALAWVARERGDIATARTLVESALAKDAGGLHPFERHGWRGQLGMLVARQGDLAGGLAIVGEALRDAEAAGAGDERLVYLLTVHGELLAEAGRYADAVHALRRSLAATARLGAGLHANAHAARTVLARCLHRLGERRDAVTLLLQTVHAFPTFLACALPALREHDRLRVVDDHRAVLDQLLAWTAADPELVPVTTVHDAVLAWKGQVARAMSAAQRAAHGDAAGLARMRRLREITSELGMGRSSASLLAERERLVALLQPARAAESVPCDVAALRAALPAGAVLVDFVLHGTGSSRAFDAFVVDARGVQRRALGPAAPIERAIGAHVALLARAVKPGSEAVAAPVSRACAACVWQPLEALVGDATHVFVVPDGALATLPLETLPAGSADGHGGGAFLIERLALSYLQDATDLARPVPPPGAPRMLAFGDIDYGGAPLGSAAMRGVPRPFAPLPATARELAAIARLLGAQATVVRGGDADEACLREAVPAATHVHLATHGFCGLDDGPGALLAGVALARANEAPGLDDGILTVDEAALLDLRACRLVVLSACQTGLGRPVAGESLLGLRRSLRIAGARTTVTSLWRVDDSATAALMEDFYRELFVARAEPAAALRAAQLRALARARERHGEGLPGLWGGFVSEGR